MSGKLSRKYTMVTPLRSIDEVNFLAQVNKVGKCSLLICDYRLVIYDYLALAPVPTRGNINEKGQECEHRAERHRLLYAERYRVDIASLSRLAAAGGIVGVLGASASS